MLPTLEGIDTTMAQLLVCSDYALTTGQLEEDIHRVSEDQDAYEKLAAAITVYNGGKHVSGRYRRSWPSVLKKLDHEIQGGNDVNSCHSCKYSINMRKAIFGTSFLREYIWAGGVTPAIIEGGAGEPPMIPNPAPNAGKEWCFAYGEADWLAGLAFVDVANAASPVDEDDDAHIPQGQINCTTGISLGVL